VDKGTRNRIQAATQKARALLEDELGQQLEGVFDIRPNGTIGAIGPQLTGRQRMVREKILASIEHERSGGCSPVDAVAAYRREAAFTTLNRFVALTMLEARGLLLPSISRGEQSGGFEEYAHLGLADGLVQLDDHGYRLYIESLFDEIAREVGVLFDRRDATSLLWPRRTPLAHLLEVLNDAELTVVWAEDETIGWVFQFFNSVDERKKMRDESQAPRNSRELAVRNQFFTPRYVVEFLVDNTLGRMWLEMYGESSRLRDFCKYFVRSKDGVLRKRSLKDPRDLRILDAACGSGHFLLYCFDLLLMIYEEAWADEARAVRSSVTGRTLRDDYPDLPSLKRAVPTLILKHNLFGVDIDPRAAQIAALALWMRAQRAWKDDAIPTAERPSVERMNIVVAEPMPGDAELVDEFARRLQPPLLGDLFRRMVGEMRLAGELGTLIPIERAIAAELRGAREQFVREQQAGAQTSLTFEGLESGGKQGEFDLSGIDDDRFFHEAEALIIQALRSFSEAATGSTSVRRHLFANDAAQGVALIDLLRSRYDVVLMNPPFGAASLAAKKEFEKAYPRTKNDIYAAFVERGIQLLHSGGLLGAITSRTGFFLSSFQKWREEILLKEAPPVVFADLGYGVMDAAMVEAAAYCLEKAARRLSDQVFLRVLEADDKAVALLEAVQPPASALGRRRFDVDPQSFSNVPRSPFAYWVGDRVRALFRSLPALQSGSRLAAIGASTKDDGRFLRAAWEVPLPANGTVPIVKGGRFSPFYDDVHLRIRWKHDGAEAKAFVSDYRARHGWSPHWKAELHNPHLYLRPGLTWPRRTNGLSMRVMPAGCIFADKGPAIFIENDDADDLLALACVTNSRAFALLVSLQLARTELAQSYEVGLIQDTPVPDFVETSTRSTLACLARRAWTLRRSLDTCNETSHAFTVPALLQIEGTDFVARADGWSQHVRAVEVELAHIQSEIDERCFELYGIDLADRNSISEGLGSGTSDASAIEAEDDGEDASVAEPEESGTSVNAAHFAAELVGWAVGVAFGRFDVRFATGALPIPPAPEPFDPLPVCSPGMLTGDDGLPAQEAPHAYPVSWLRDGIVVDDAGHSDDVVTLVRLVFDVAFGAAADAWWQDCAQLLGGDLRRWLARGFFETHLKGHSKSRRKAPVYWQLATPTASYSVWLHAHRANADTLYRVLNDYITPKLRLEERTLTYLTQEAGPSPSASQRKDIESQRDFVEELRSFRDEVARVAPLWRPQLDDGILITCAPLWRLMPQHRIWQRELRACWAKLANDEHDWSHLAMHLWPDRVIPKCAHDRSLAIAHGLEDEFWAEGADGKWSPRQVDDATVEGLVQERSSTGVKAAVTELVAAG